MSPDEGTWCELCNISLPIPVTYHMRIVHPGCEKPALGKGYNSVGAFCEGWAGNCGEGGKGASSWYLMCDSCRDKYIEHQQSNLNINNVNTTAEKSADVAQPLPAAAAAALSSVAQPFSVQKFDSLFGIESNLIVNSEVYAMMKENSLFLLELSSTGPAAGTILNQQKRSPAQMPVVSETELHQIASDLHNKPSTSAASAGDLMGGGGAKNGSSSKGMFSASTPYRSGAGAGGGSAVNGSEVPEGVSPELMWQVPNTFSCLDSLGCSMSATMHQPYTLFDVNGSGDVGGSALGNGYERVR